MKKCLYIAVIALISSIPLHAQQFSLSTNLLDYACLGTMNMDFSCSVSRHCSLTAGVRYNPFTFNSSDVENQFQFRQRSAALGVRLWPWHTMSGWWFAGKIRYQEYNYGGLFSWGTEDGDRYGCSFSAGYTYMLSSNLNLEFGLGAWAGMSFFRRYSCVVCGTTVGHGRKYFLLPDDLMISLVYVF